MAHEETALIAIPRETAARAFQACAGLDPDGVETPDSAAHAGDCYAISGRNGVLVLSIRIEDGTAWIVAAAGTGEGMTADGLRAVEAYGRSRGCRAVGFQTLRRGLVKQAQALGYRAEPHERGHLLAKEL